MDTTIKDFESAIAEADTIARALEEGDLPLEKSLELYERGVHLLRFCQARLEAAERRIEILNERGELRSAPASFGRRERRQVKTAATDLREWLVRRRDEVEAALERYLPATGDTPAVLTRGHAL